MILSFFENLTSNLPVASSWTFWSWIALAAHLVTCAPYREGGGTSSSLPKPARVVAPPLSHQSPRNAVAGDDPEAIVVGGTAKKENESRGAGAAVGSDGYEGTVGGGAVISILTAASPEPKREDSERYGPCGPGSHLLRCPRCRERPGDAPSSSSRCRWRVAAVAAIAVMGCLTAAALTLGSGRLRRAFRSEEAVSTVSAVDFAAVRADAGSANAPPSLSLATINDSARASARLDNVFSYAEKWEEEKVEEEEDEKTQEEEGGEEEGATTTGDLT